LDAAGIQHAVDVGLVVAVIPKVCPLLGIFDTFSSFFVGVDSLFKGVVVEPSGLLKEYQKLFGLAGIGAQAVFVST
jgi:hypothetical protein